MAKRISKTVAAPVQPVVAPAAVQAAKSTGLAPVTGELALQVATSFAALAIEHAKASATFAARVGLVADALGTPLTYSQWDKQIAPVVKDAFKGSNLNDARVAEYAARFKVIALARLTGDASLAPIAGEPLKDFLQRVRPLLETFKLADGTPMVAPSVTGAASSKRGRKPGAAAANRSAPKITAPAPADTGSAGKAENGTGEPAPSPNKAAALNLMSQNADHAERLLVILTKHRAAFDAWAETLIPLTRASTAPVKKDAAPVTALAAAMAKAKAPEKANGAAH